MVNAAVPAVRATAGRQLGRNGEGLGVPRMGNTVDGSGVKGNVLPRGGNCVRMVGKRPARQRGKFPSGVLSRGINVVAGVN